MLRIHNLQRLSDFYEIGKEILCEVWHLKVPWQSWVIFFIHYENWCWVVIFQSCGLVCIIVNSEKSHIFCLWSNFFVNSSKSFTTVTWFGEMENHFIVSRKNSFFSFLSNNKFGIFFDTLSYRLASEEFKLGFFILKFRVMSLIKNSFNKIF